jgi:5-formyltetrahydrofolate cyclo-ligase
LNKKDCHKAHMKQDIRTIMLKTRNNLTQEQKTTAAKLVYQRIISLDIYKHAKTIALYHPFNNELDVNIFSKNPSKTTLYPVIDGDKLNFVEATDTKTFMKNSFGIPEPTINAEKIFPPEHIDLVIMPCVAIDTFGTRIGYGKGFYDKTFADNRPKHLMGVGYDFQKVPLIPKDIWDITLDSFVCPGFYLEF